MVDKLTGTPSVGPTDSSPRSPVLIWRELLELRRKINELIDALALCARLGIDNVFASATLQTFSGLIIADADNDSANIQTRWLELVSTHDGLDFVNSWASETLSNVRRIRSSNGKLMFEKASGDDASEYQYLFDGTVTAPDLKLSATIADPTAYTVSNPPTQAEVSAILTTLKGIYNALK